MYILRLQIFLTHSFVFFMPGWSHWWPDFTNRLFGVRTEPSQGGQRHSDVIGTSAIHIGPIYLICPWRLLIWNAMARVHDGMHSAVRGRCWATLTLPKILLLGGLNAQPRTHFAPSSRNVYIKARVIKSLLPPNAWTYWILNSTINNIFNRRFHTSARMTWGFIGR